MHRNISFFGLFVTVMSQFLNELDGMKVTATILAGMMLLNPAQAEILKTAPACNVPADLPPAPEIVESNSARTLAWLGPIHVEVQRRMPGSGRSDEKLRVGLVIDPVTGKTLSTASPNLRRDTALEPCD